MYKIFYTSKFKKDYKTVQKRKYNIDLLREVTILLSQSGELPKNITLTNLAAFIPIVGNATLNLTGF